MKFQRLLVYISYYRLFSSRKQHHNVMHNVMNDAIQLKRQAKKKLRDIVELQAVFLNKCINVFITICN